MQSRLPSLRARVKKKSLTPAPCPARAESTSVKLKSKQEEIFEVEKEVACRSVTVKNMVDDTGLDTPVPLPMVDSKILVRAASAAPPHAPPCLPPRTPSAATRARPPAVSARLGARARPLSCHRARALVSRWRGRSR